MENRLRTYIFVRLNIYFIEVQRIQSQHVGTLPVRKSL